jgi:hypothetical protein
MNDPQSNSHDCSYGGSWSFQEFTAELESFPPGTKGTFRPGRLEEAREIWESFQKSKQTPFVEFTDSAPDEPGGQS